MVWQELGRLIGKLLYMHLIISVALSHMYHTQQYLTQVTKDSTWKLTEIHQDMAGWSDLVDYIVPCTTYLVKTFQQDPTHLVFLHTYCIGVSAVWLGPGEAGKSLVYNPPWTDDITSIIILEVKPRKAITK